MDTRPYLALTNYTLTNTFWLLRFFCGLYYLILWGCDVWRFIGWKGKGERELLTSRGASPRFPFFEWATGWHVGHLDDKQGLYWQGFGFIAREF
jgi:hypothetical protein